MVDRILGASPQGGVAEKSADITRTDDILAEHATAIRALGKRVVGDVIEIGRRLADCESRASHGEWLPWLEREFGWSRQTADRYINVYVMARDKVSNLDSLDLPISSLYLLAAPSTPEVARTEVIDLASKGEAPAYADVKATVDKHKRKTPTTSTNHREQPAKAKPAIKPTKAEPPKLVVDNDAAEQSAAKRKPATEPTEPATAPTVILTKGQVQKQVERLLMVWKFVCPAAQNQFLAQIGAHRDDRNPADTRQATVDPNSLSKTAKERLESAIRQAKRELGAEFEQAVQAEVRSRLDEGGVLTAWQKDMDEAREVIRSRKGVMMRKTYRLILSWLHPDRVTDTDSKEQIRRAFDEFRKLELVLCNEKEMPTTASAFPRTYEELMKRREEVRAERSARSKAARDRGGQVVAEPQPESRDPKAGDRGATS